MRKIIKNIAGPFLLKKYKKLSRNPYPLKYKGIKIIVYPKVFSPKFTISTKIFIHFIEKLPLKDKKVLELGAGSGLISFFCDKKGANVTATDISDEAIKGLQKNNSLLGANLSIIKSDLFELIPQNSFDYIFINPPYYPKKPKNMEEKAWFCGENFDFFELFFAAYKVFSNHDTCYMILSQDCDLKKIKEIGKKYECTLKSVYTKKRWGERNFIFSLDRFSTP